MPIQIKPVTSLHEVKERLAVFEGRFDKSTAAFVATAGVDIPEFDSIQWNLLAMQKRAFEEDLPSQKVFSARFKSSTEPVDKKVWYEEVAA